MGLAALSAPLEIADAKPTSGIPHRYFTSTAEHLRMKHVSSTRFSASADASAFSMPYKMCKILLPIFSCAPRDRQPVQTYVLEHDWGILGDAMRRELDRGGQVYYLHNRVENIESTAGRIRQMLGENVSIGIAHGKMSESQLSRVMQDMADGEIQVLVCTTIIETGIDIPNVQKPEQSALDI